MAFLDNSEPVIKRDRDVEQAIGGILDRIGPLEGLRSGPIVRMIEI